MALSNYRRISSAVAPWGSAVAQCGFAVALLALAGGTAAADGKPDLTKLKSGPIVVESKRITSFKRFEAEQPLAKLTFRGGLELTSPSPYFGGWSALLLDDDAKSFVSISDAGEWMTGTLVYDGVHPAGIAKARLGPLRDAEGRPIKRGRDRDSESIALASGTLASGSVLIGFEGRHRIERYDMTPAGFSAVRGNLKLPPEAKKMGSNLGLEALTVLTGGPYKGSAIAFSERLYDQQRNHTGWIWTADVPQTVHLKNIGDYDITDISSLDDGTLFVLERRFRWTEGVKMRLRRVAPEDLSPDHTSEGEILIEADLNDQIDNMEGLAVTRLKTGEILITMISDDNFNQMLQRTLLLQFVLKDSGQAKARPPD
ncbi:esterase-like activity of phytase family protein [Hyphomicrobium sp. 99]|uniref:esterase-like activity of phytase family protein n=1 Tax=Hyphomicrobium sp. 99 TaxID=1163419 RepID=UPI001FD8E0C2|nr:esterase-like activity of phytase family protein [Hyphomicrobium sp. 99]